MKKICQRIIEGKHHHAEVTLGAIENYLFKFGKWNSIDEFQHVEKEFKVIKRKATQDIPKHLCDLNQWIYLPEDIFSILIENIPDLWMSVIKGMAKLPIDVAYIVIVLMREVYNALVDLVTLPCFFCQCVGHFPCLYFPKEPKMR